MILRKFTGSSIHGFLNFDVSLHRDLTFLTGLNGSGKTTAINAIIALITPSLTVLSDLNYEDISVVVRHEDSDYSIRSDKVVNSIRLSVSGIKEIFEFNKFELMTEAPPHREFEYEQAYYRELLANNSQHPVLKFLSTLPTPMFLGLDRRARIDDEPLRTRSFPARQTKLGRNVFSMSLSRSLVDASSLAEESYRDSLIEIGRVGDELRRTMLLEFLSIKPIKVGALEVPTSQDTRSIANMKRDLRSLHNILGLPANEVTNRVQPFISFLEETIAKIPKNAKISNLNSDNVSEVVSWNFNKTQLQRIKAISDMVADYNKRTDIIQSSSKSYLDSINAFLRDSGKKVNFDENGYISFSIEGVHGEKPIIALSSGEAQIFVLLTHLFFNKLARGANIFIIDEPELSLHVQWQELFVDSILKASSEIQYILATHSPSIILERTDKCIDMGRRAIS